MKQRIQQEQRKSVQPSHIIIHILDFECIIPYYRLDYFNFIFADSFAISDFHGLIRSEAQHIGGVNHGFSNLRVPAIGLSRGSHHSPHEGLVLVRHFFAILIDYSSGPHGTAGLHIYGVTCDADQCPCRSCLHVHICDYRHFTPQDSCPDAIRSIYGTTIRIKVKQHIIRSGSLSLFKSADHLTLSCLIDIHIKSYTIKYCKRITGMHQSTCCQRKNECKNVSHIYILFLLQEQI